MVHFRLERLMEIAGNRLTGADFGCKLNLRLKWCEVDP